MKKLTIATIIVLVLIFGYYFLIKSNRKEGFSQNNRTISECVELSEDVRINEKTKSCFDDLSNNEFLSLSDPKNKDAMNLYNEVEDYYDTRTEAQKQADTEKNKKFFEKIIELNSN